MSIGPLEILLVLVFCGFVAAKLWQRGGGSPAVGFFLGFLFGPIGLLIAALSRAKSSGVSK